MNLIKGNMKDSQERYMKEKEAKYPTQFKPTTCRWTGWQPTVGPNLFFQIFKTNLFFAGLSIPTPQVVEPLETKFPSEPPNSDVVDFLKVWSLSIIFMLSVVPVAMYPFKCNSLFIQKPVSYNRSGSTLSIY